MSKGAPTISVSPEDCLQDEPVTIKISGLEKDKVYTLAAFVKDGEGILYHSLAHYKSDEDGKIDVTTDSALGGNFRGVHPMGLFNNIIPLRLDIRKYRFSFTDFSNPLLYTLSVFEGPVAPVITMKGEDHNLKEICSVKHHRHVYAPNCKRIPVKYGKVRGVLHLPPGKGPFPGIVETFGASIGLKEHRAAMFASHGFATLALAFFAYEDLPSNFDDLKMSYFQEAVDFMLSREEVIKGTIGALGVSKSVDIVLNMARDIEAVKAIVVINGSIANLGGTMTLKDGQVIPPVPWSSNNIMIERDGSVSMQYMMENMHDVLEKNPDCVIPVEDIDADILWIAAQDDKALPAEAMVDLAKRRCDSAAQCRCNLKVLKYPGAGHLLEPPYTPFCDVSANRVAESAMQWGGRADLHCKAQEQSWSNILSFFKKNLVK